MPEMEESNIGNRKLVLGFDAGCTTCSDLAERIEAQASGRLEVRSLRDPQMVHWRKEALGVDAPWAPTLVEIGDGKVKAWTGLRMGVRLSRKLGPTTSWKVAKILGEIQGNRRPERPAYSVVSRSQFLKGLGGAIVGMSLLSGTGSLSAAEAADEHWLSRLSIVSSKELSRKQAVAAWARMIRGRHLRRLLASRAVNENPVARRISGGMLSVARTDAASRPTASIKGVRHSLKGGGQLLALVYQEDDALIVSYRFDKPGQKTRQFSRLIENESEESVSVLAEAEDGDVFVSVQDAAPEGEFTVTARRTCRRNSQCPGACYICRCASLNLRCLFNCCAHCGLCRWAPFAACIACALVYCPICASVNNCCNYKACTYRPSCG